MPVTVLNNSTLTWTVPTATQLGDLPFVVLKGTTSSHALPFGYSAVQPPRLNVAPQVAVGHSLEWTFGCAPGDFWIMLASLGQTTATVRGWSVLMPFTIAVMGIADDQGLGAFTAHIPASAAGITVHTQIISGPGYLTGATPIVATYVTP